MQFVFGDYVVEGGAEIDNWLVRVKGQVFKL